MSGIKNKKQFTYEESHKEINGILYKRCNYHNEFFPNENDWFPCTDEYFYKSNKNKSDGLHPLCKKCNKAKYRKWIGNNEVKYRTYVKIRDSSLSEKRILQKRKIANEQRMSGYQSQYRKDNKDKVKKYQQKRDQHKKHTISKTEWESCKQYFNYRCAYCGLPIEEHYNIYAGELKLTDFHKEHFDDEGANDLSNCIPACKSCNSSKHTFKFEEWYDENNPIFSTERLNKIYRWINEDHKNYIKLTKQNILINNYSNSNIPIEP